jgi:hypothetical protein
MTDSNRANTTANNTGAVEDGQTSAPFRLYTRMTLTSTSLGQEVYSPSPITINGVTVFSVAPIRIIGVKYPKRYPVHIEPSADLEPAFAEGWNALPDELKIKVLSHNLLNSETIDHGIMQYTPQLRSLLHHLRTTPAIAAHSRDLYYTHNVFSLRPTAYTVLDTQLPLPTGRYCLLYPTPAVNAHIRYIEFLCDLDARAWQFLLKFSNGNYGFGDIRYITLVFRASYLHLKYLEEFEGFIENAVGNGVRFGCEGHVVLMTEEEDLSDDDRRHMGRMNELMKRMVHFGCSKLKRGVAPD